MAGHTTPQHATGCHAMPHHGTPCYARPCLTAPLHAVPCYTMPCHAMQYTTPYHAMQCHTTSHCAMLGQTTAGHATPHHVPRCCSPTMAHSSGTRPSHPPAVGASSLGPAKPPGCGVTPHTLGIAPRPGEPGKQLKLQDCSLHPPPPA